MVKSYQNFINNEWVAPSTKDYYDVVNPASQAVIARAAKSGVEDAKKAIDAARAAFDNGEWPEMTPAERGSFLWKLADSFEKETPRFAKLESLNVGKTIKYARDSDMPFIADNLRYFAGAARMLAGLASMEYVDFHGKRHHKGLGTSILRREPIGVCAGIVPWNYPLYIACWKFAPALAAGNSIVLKPASLTPLTLLEFCELVKKAGFPEGVFNVVTGPGEVIGAALAESPKVDMISLTGDVSTGKKIMQQSSGSLKKVHLELGGKAPLIVLEDADLDAVAEGACVGGYWNAGQDCTAVTRVYVPERLHDELVGKMVDVTKRFKLGDPSKESTDEGPMVSERQREKVEYYVELARKEGAKIEVGGKRPTGKEFEKGWYYEPTILTNVKHRSRVCQEEIFGPVVAVFKYKALEDAVKAANDVAYGLAASVWGKDITKCNYVARKLDFGTVWVNEHGILTSETPHGGFKQSGYGKDLSLHALEEYTRTKHVYIDQTGLKRKPWHYVVYGRP